MKNFTLNVQHTVTSKLAPLRNLNEFHEFPELLCLQDISTVSFTFRFHSLYEPFSLLVFRSAWVSLFSSAGWLVFPMSSLKSGRMAVV